MHISVLSNEALKYLKLSSNDNVIDCTVGSGGHAIMMLEAISPEGKLLGIDRDEKALELSRVNLKKFENRTILIHGRFGDLDELVLKNNFKKISGILLDIGMSSMQLGETGRGFSFKKAEYLDMRMDQSGGLTAADIVNSSSKVDLEKIFREYGEESFSKKIARAIVERREKQNVETTNELADLVCEVVPRGFHAGKIHPATKVFQALRIAVNDELNELKKVLPKALTLLDRGGRMVVISFHSIEDRIVKDFFKLEKKNCICPDVLPICRCNHRSRVRIITRKPVVPAPDEIVKNPRSRSAKLRCVEKI
ncbi:MAG: hypothetical protein ACD_63C00125G0005 [uncultured bacterium]|nr:MAG: hypothetical protein ACD_63C00125G0005 [uncultured bacterium]